MRHVIYLLVVVNLVYFSWNMLQNVPHEGGVSHVRQLPPAVRHLDTVQERTDKRASSVAEDARVMITAPPVAAGPPAITESQQEATDIDRVETLTATEPPGAVAPPSSCHVFGPFPADAEMKTVEHRLNELGYKPRVRSGDARIEAGYWAYLPAMEREEALRITRLLEANKDRDYLILKGNALSLGTYDSRSWVDIRLKMLQKYGIDAVAEPRYVTRTVYWLDLDLLDDERDVVDSIRGEYPNVQVQNTACR